LLEYVFQKEPEKYSIEKNISKLKFPISKADRITERVTESFGKLIKRDITPIN
jgi:hypothetical protein